MQEYASLCGKNDYRLVKIITIFDAGVRLRIAFLAYDRNRISNVTRN